MATTYTPQIIADAALIPLADDVCISPPIWWQTLASDWNAESTTGISAGRYIDASGEVESVGIPALQDTYKTGTAGRTGRPFTVITGTWKDDVVAPWSDKYILAMLDNTSGITFEVRDTTGTTAGILHAYVIITRGNTPIGATAHAVAQTYAYLELCYGDVTNYRLAMVYGSPIALEYYTAAAGWSPVAIARKLGHVESYLERNGNRIHFKIKPDSAKGVMVVEVGDGHFLRHAVRPTNPDPSRPNAAGRLPTYDNYRFVGKNGWAAIEVHPLRYPATTITKGALAVGRPLDNLGSGRAVVNLLGDDTTAANTDVTVQQSGDNDLTFTAVSSMVDAGAGVGSAEPARYSDITIFIPAVYASYQLGYPFQRERLRVMKCREVQVWDDANRWGHSYGSITMNNFDGIYTGIYGNFALGLSASNGSTWGPRVRGIMGIGEDGMTLTGQDPVQIVNVPWSDNSYKMNIPLGQEVILDGLCIYTAARLIAQIGNISERWLTTIPNTGFPPYPDAFPFPILGKGTGLTPKYRFLPDASPLGVLLALIQDTGQITVDYFGPVRSTPFYMWHDVYGQFRFEPWDPAFQPVSKYYYAVDPTGQGQIEEIHVSNSIAQLRTEVTIQGQDAFSYELLQLHIPLNQNLGVVGYRYPWLERNSRYASEAGMLQAGRTAAIQASLGTQVVRMKVPFDPLVFAGQVCGIWDNNTLGRQGYFVILSIESEYGIEDVTGREGYQVCSSTVVARSIENSMVL